MRLPVIRASAIATVATMALAACANRSGMVPSSPSAMAPTTAQNHTSADDAASTQDSLALKTCATSPPQYQWIFKGACQTFDLTSTGGHFSLSENRGITVNGLIGRNSAKGAVEIALADALDKNGDIKMYKGKAFPPYKANGTTYVYASAVNQSTQFITPIMVKGKPIFQYVITDAKGFGDANICASALLIFRAGKPSWSALPESGRVKGKTVTMTQYAVPKGFRWPPKIPLYFAVKCYYHKRR